ncbi:MAG TPA: 3-deoxy-8-phosphooctulonate synthase [Candidatus Polarisedimenticolia bacterium]|nr:3-deoxy-8-phosphooctulonate synthase [Candidatus Polarisedimenticolia bacterium]
MASPAAPEVSLSPGIVVGEGRVPLLIAGPCVIEGEGPTLALARALKEQSAAAGIPLVFKASFDKANRSALGSFRGPGLKEGLRILDRIKRETGLPVLSDIHEIEQAETAATVLDILQIPAFLCRQTDLLVAAARTGLPVNVKKGQFLSPWEMKNVVEKLVSSGATRILLTERGSSFGYQNLVVDFRSIPVMRELGFPVIFDATHSVQRPGALGSSSGGDRQFIETLARAAIAAGADGIFVEVHEDPAKALSDGANALPLARLPALLRDVRQLAAVVGRES